jgi:hypothetical protein
MSSNIAKLEYVGFVSASSCSWSTVQLSGRLMGLHLDDGNPGWEEVLVSEAVVIYLEADCGTCA